jgi:four helix bundle protein
MSSILQTESKALAKDIVLLCRHLQQQQKEYTLSDQLLRCGTSVGANLYEANYAQSRKDFISKLEIALKECYETQYWLELFKETQLICEDEFQALYKACGSIRHKLIAAIRTAKQNTAP